MRALLIFAGIACFGGSATGEPVADRLRTAAQDSEGGVAAIQQMATEGADLNALDSYGKNALLWAAESHNFDHVLVLLDLGAKANVADAEGKTPLMSLAVSGEDATTNARRLAALEKLIASGADVNARDKKGKTPLLHAVDVTNDHPAPTVRALLAAGADVNARDIDGNSALHDAALHPPESLAIILEAGGDLHARNKYDRTPLDRAARSSRVADWAENAFANAKLLLAHGADPNAVDKTGGTALLSVCNFFSRWMSEEQPTRMMKLLLQHGARPDHADTNGLTPLMVCGASGYVSGAAILLAAGVDVNRTDARNASALFQASFSGEAPIVTLLIGFGADIDAVNADGDTPLLVAARKGRATVIAELLRKKPDITATARDGKTALLLAAESHHKLGIEEREYGEMINALLEADADPSARDEQGRTALLWAAGAGSATSVRALISHGATQNTDAAGHHPLKWALGNGHAKVAGILRRYPIPPGHFIEPEQ